MKIENETFTKILHRFIPKYELRSVFTDFLTMSICASARNPATSLSHYEDLYLQTIDKYKEDPIRHEFPKAFAALVTEMDARLHTDNANNDVLGEFYEQHLYRKDSSQFFTPWPICHFMARSTKQEMKGEQEKPLRILDPSCGSGRMLLAAKEVHGRAKHFFGIDIDEVCVKMTALNMFFNGMWNSEVMCGNALLREDFNFSYRISLLPFGIFRIDEKEKSLLWNILKNTWEENRTPKKDMSSVLMGEAMDKFDASRVSQIKLF